MAEAPGGGQVENKLKRKAEAFFSTLKLSDHGPLEGEKLECPTCGTKRKYYCYSCKAGVSADRTPRVTLPWSLDIIHHPSEKLSKSSAVHAVVVSEEARMIESNALSEDYDPETTLLLFPSEHSRALNEVPVEELRSKYKKLVVVDSQWQKAASILKLPQLAKLPCISIKSYETLFWRYQPKGMGEDHLATIEAIYYFYRELWDAIGEGEYAGQYDDLLYYYSHMFNVIQDHYREKGRTFKKRNIGD